MSDEDDFNNEFERARQKPVRAIPPQTGGYTRCMGCGAEGRRLRCSPGGDRLLCTGFFEGTPLADTSCYEKADRAQAIANGEEYRRHRDRVLEEKQQAQTSNSKRMKPGDW